MKIDRKRNAVNGTLTGFIHIIVQVVFPFAIRSVFIRTIGMEYLGLNSLFTAVLQVLNLAELGVSSALVFSMYRPIVEDDEEKICQLMNLYKVYYRIIGLVILGIGLILVPFLPYLIKSDIPGDVNIYVLYALNLGTTVLSYWIFAYYNSLFEAHQRNDILNLISVSVNIVMFSLQIVILIVFRNYYMFLVVKVGGQIVTSLMTSLAARKCYPKYRPRGRLPKDERKAINLKIKDVFVARLGGVVNNSVDSIVVSAFLGLQLLAIYQNYYYVISSLMALFQIFFNACMAGVGNSLIVRDCEENKKLLYNIHYIVYAALNFCCASLICLYQPFMELWVGNEYVLPFPFVILFAVYLYAEEAPRTFFMFKDAGGIWKQDRVRGLTVVAVNIVLNLTLTPIIGLYGIILSTIASLLLVALPWVVYNTNKYLFRIDLRKYLQRLGLYTLVIAADAAALGFLCSFITFDSLWLTLLIRLLLCTLLSNGVFLLCFRKLEENQYLKETVRSGLRKIRSRISGRKKGEA